MFNHRTVFVLALWLMAACSAVFAQEAPPADEVAVVWSESFKLRKNAEATQMLGADSAFFYVLRDEQGRSAYNMLDVFDRKTMKRVSENVIFLPDIPGYVVSLDNIFFLGERLLMVLTAFDAKAGIVRSYAAWLGRDGKPQDRPELLAEATARRRGVAPFGYVLSRDGQRMLIYPGNPAERRVSERYAYRVVDANLQTVWQKDLELPVETELLEIGSYRIDSRGRMFVMTGVGQPEKSLRGAERQRSDREYTVIAFDPEANTIKEFDVAVDGKWVIASSFDVDENDNVVIGGFYSNDRYFSIAGTFFLRIDGATRKIEATGMKAFERELLNQFARRSNDREQELQDFYFDHFIVRPDGGAVFVAEQYYIRQQWRTDFTTGRQEIIYYYYYNDLLVVDVLPDGNINWARRVPKEQVSINDRGAFSSYALARSGSDLFVLFNDDPSNVELLEQNPKAVPRAMNSLKRSSATLVRIGSDGSQMRKNLFRSRDSDVLLRPKIWYSPGEGELFLYARQRKNYRFGHLQF